MVRGIHYFSAEVKTKIDVIPRGCFKFEYASPASLKPLPAMLFNLYFHRLEVVSRYRDPQLQVGEHNSYLLNLIPIQWQIQNVQEEGA